MCYSIRSYQTRLVPVSVRTSGPVRGAERRGEERISPRHRTTTPRRAQKQNKTRMHNCDWTIKDTGNGPGYVQEDWRGCVCVGGCGLYVFSVFF